MLRDQPLAVSAAPREAGPPRILVVDDDESVRLTIQGVLELDGYTVHTCEGAPQAFELLRGHDVDLVLTDLRLGACDGIELLRELHRRAPDAVGIVMTGYASIETAVNALREGAYDYLLKPCNVLELRTTVARGLERNRLATQLRERLADLEVANQTIRALNLELEERVDRATANLRKQIAARDEFTASVSHDLTSPLTFIKGLAHLRRRRAVLTPETQPLIEALEQIESTAGRMAQQLHELVDASRQAAGRPLELHRARMDLLALARQVVAEHQQTTDRHALRVASDVPSVVGSWDETRLARVLDNLLNNAIKYSPGGGPIEVGLTIDDSLGATTAVLRVLDHGEGIPESDVSSIFERFRRGGNVEGRIPGTGIGLAGARQIVELHHGSISVQSSLGTGTTFTVRLPLEGEPSPS